MSATAAGPRHLRLLESSPQLFEAGDDDKAVALDSPLFPLLELISGSSRLLNWHPKRTESRPGVHMVKVGDVHLYASRAYRGSIEMVELIETEVPAARTLRTQMTNILRHSAVDLAFERAALKVPWPTLRRRRTLIGPTILMAIGISSSSLLLPGPHFRPGEIGASAILVILGFAVWLWLWRLADPLILGPSVTVNETRIPLDAAREQRGFATADFVTSAAPILGWPAIIASNWRGLAPAVLSAGLATGLLWDWYRRVRTMCLSKHISRYFVEHARIQPLPHEVAELLCWALANAALCRPSPRRRPRWVVPWLYRQATYYESTFIRRRVKYSILQTPEQRSAVALFGRRFAHYLRRSADALEAAYTQEEYELVIEGLLAHINDAIAGDLTFLGDNVLEEHSTPWWRRALTRMGPAILLVGTAVVIPYLPGTTAAAGAVAAAQVGLVIGAVYSISGVGGDAQNTAADAWKSVSTSSKG